MMMSTENLLRDSSVSLAAGNLIQCIIIMMIINLMMMMIGKKIRLMKSAERKKIIIDLLFAEINSKFNILWLKFLIEKIEKNNKITLTLRYLEKRFFEEKKIQYQKIEKFTIYSLISIQ